MSSLKSYKDGVITKSTEEFLKQEKKRLDKQNRREDMMRSPNFLDGPSLKKKKIIDIRSFSPISGGRKRRKSRRKTRKRRKSRRKSRKSRRKSRKSRRKRRKSRRKRR
jgi:hypothetical protein